MSVIAPSRWLEPTNMDVADETARLVLLGWEPRRRNLLAWVAALAFIVLVMPRTGTYPATGLLAAWLGASFGTTYSMVQRQRTLGRPVERVWTAVFTVAAIWIVYLGTALAFSSVIGPDPDDAPFTRVMDWIQSAYGGVGVALVFGLFALLVVGLVVQGWPARRRYLERLREQAEMERAARSA